MDDLEPAGGPSVARRVVVLLVAFVLFAVSDNWFRVMLPPPRPMLPGALLIGLALAASLGWLFVGRPSRNPDGVDSALPSIIVPVAIFRALVRRINRLAAAEAVKDTLFRILVALMFGGMMLVWDLYLVYQAGG
ncbi:MAG TPA: hypothetical protein VIL17_03055 [Coriobacteriia bacterium]